MAGGRRGQGGNLPCSGEGGRRRRGIGGQGVRGGRGAPACVLGWARGGREGARRHCAEHGGGGERR